MTLRWSSYAERWTILVQIAGKRYVDPTRLITTNRATGAGYLTFD